MLQRDTQRPSELRRADLSSDGLYLPFDLGQTYTHRSIHGAFTRARTHSLTIHIRGDWRTKDGRVTQRPCLL